MTMVALIVSLFANAQKKELPTCIRFSRFTAPAFTGTQATNESALPLGSSRMVQTRTMHLSESNLKKMLDAKLKNSQRADLRDSVLQPIPTPRKYLVLSSAIALSAGSLIALNELWYKDYPRSSFHFFNDDSEWLQMDKAGHAMTTYSIGRLGYDILKWSGYDSKQATLTSAITGLAYLSAIEVLDGKSAAWGFSVGDMIANCLGTSAFLSQQLLWHDQRIVLKYSYHSSPFAKMNPSQLGRNFQQRILKDYNAQTYWSSINVHSFLASDAAFPKWINVAFGYGATGMIRAKNDVRDVNNFQRMREFYFSFDADLSRVRWPKKWMRITAKVISLIKIPSPTIRVQENGSVKVIALY
jgi:hypothetical protein